ncbi:hypothetical protein PAMC26510_30260 [Caballeronia sordidicola]|uniref:Uncharacterized protein n=1 Tax=Caballeronia sordidicola TaxID=196367 RepID=A0A242M960_CABSO|nr:hypothetical protein PAMC26510_30260 [Caballeronia sordidicola]
MALLVRLSSRSVAALAALFAGDRPAFSQTDIFDHSKIHRDSIHR